MTTVKKVALRCIAAAVILETYLNNSFIQTEGKLSLKHDDYSQLELMFYQEAVLKPLLHKKDAQMRDLNWWLKRASMLPNRQLKLVERTIADSLKGMHLLEEIPNLLGCDLYYTSADVAIKEYRSNLEEYTGITESLRAEILEDGVIADETICMLWLLRESGGLHDIFSNNELEIVTNRMNELYQSSSLAKAVFPINIHQDIEIIIKGILNSKKLAIKNSVGTGINFAFPVFERSQSVFIETEAWFSNSEQRLKDVKARLESKGHIYKVMHEGEVPLIKVDNIVYEAIPAAIGGRLPIHGVRLRKYSI